MPWQKGKILKETGYMQQREDQQEKMTQEDVSKLQQKTIVQQRPPADPSESTVHGKEVHTAVQKQVQKEVNRILY